MAFVKAKGFQPASRGAQGRFVRSPGGRGQPGSRAAGNRALPPRGRADMTCVNCERKSHAASECREVRKERSDRPCFTCGKPGHEAKNCPNKSFALRRADVKAIENGPARIAAVMCVTEKVVDSDGFTMAAKGAASSW